MTTQFYTPDHMTQIAKFYKGLSDLIDECDLDPTATASKSDLYVLVKDITVRHADDWTFGRIEMEDDFLHFNMDVPEQDEDDDDNFITLEATADDTPELIKILRAGMENVTSIPHDLRHAVSRFCNDLEADHRGES